MCILIYPKFDATFIKNDISSLSLRIKNLKIDIFFDFSSGIYYNSETDVLELLSTLRLINVNLGTQRPPLADAKFPPPAQRMKTIRACEIIILLTLSTLS